MNLGWTGLCHTHITGKKLRCRNVKRWKWKDLLVTKLGQQRLSPFSPQKTLGGTFLVWKEWKRGASVTTDLARASLLQGFLSSKVCFPRLCKLSFYVFKCAACWLWGEWFPESSGFPILGKVIRVTWNVCKTWKSRRPHRGSWLDNVLYCDSIAHSTSGPFFTYFFFFFLRRIIFFKEYWICYNITSVFLAKRHMGS